MQIAFDRGGSLETAALDELSRTARRRLAAQLGPGLKTVGVLLQVEGNMFGTDRISGESSFGNGDDGVVELGLVTHAGAELVEGAVRLLELGHPYPAAALVRQLVEIEYLTWSFSARPETWGKWLRSTADGRRKIWQPRHLRDASGGLFHVEEYQTHCEIGGHPTPPGIRALVGAAIDRRVADELIWWEICRHAGRIWERVREGAQAHDAAIVPHQDVDAALGDWAEADALNHLPSGE